MRGKTVRRQYLMWVYLARLLAFANPMAQFGEIRNARLSAAAFHLAHLLKHQAHTTLECERVKSGNI